MPFHGVIGELVEISRIGAQELSLVWQIRKFSSLKDGRLDFYRSPEFRFGDERWLLMVWSNWWNKATPGGLRLRLCRLFDMSPHKTFRISVGIIGSGGAEKEREVEREFSDNGYYDWYGFCLISELRKEKSTLTPCDTLTITCVIKRIVSGAARGVLPHPHSYIHDVSVVREPVSSTNESLLDKRRELPADVLVIYSYKELQTATQNFCDLPLGEGSFGTVYRAVIRGYVVAVKRLKEPVDKQFFTELKTLTNYKHQNLLSLLGCSLGPTCCLLYEYMPNGSLEDRLSCKDQSEPLSWQTRLSISYGSALGINHLHTFGEEPMVHRDIKSANILLDQNFVPKVGDFGMVRTGSKGGSSTTVVTENVCGTRVYMAREALSGDVSVKLDTFSFGVVLLELLTGLSPGETTGIENCEDLIPKLDSKAKWNKQAAVELYGITQRCLTVSKRSRPAISEILEDLRKLSLLR